MDVSHVFMRGQGGCVVFLEEWGRKMEEKKKKS